VVYGGRVMVRRRTSQLYGAAVACAVCLCQLPLPAASQPSLDLNALMTRVGDRVVAYYRRAQGVICLEKSTVQPINHDWGAEGFARTVESELRVEFKAPVGDALPDATIIRDVRLINGRAPRERDRKDRSACTDPNPMSAAPLAFLLPSHRDDYVFTSVKNGRDKGRSALIIDFMSADRKSKPELIPDPSGHDDCFDWSGPIATRGQVWLDAETNDVLRVDRRLDGPVDVNVPWDLQRRYLFDRSVVLERDDVSVRYKTIVFNDPDETILLPDSIDETTVLRSGLQSVRRSDRFSEYRRFLTGSRIVK
jgi:hypothetical protein